MLTKLRKRMAGILAATLITSTMMTNVLASDFSNHWAAETIAKWQEKELLRGYSDGTMRPDRQITRAEFAALLVRMFGYTEVADATVFTDVVEGEWYTLSVQAISHAGLMYEDGVSFRPHDPITREEAVYALAHAYVVEGMEEEVTFADQELVSTWAIEQVEAMYANGFIVGDTEGLVHPKSPLTRAEFLTMADRMTADIINVAGTYTEDVDGNLIVNTRDVTLKDMVIEGNLYLGEGIGDGDVHLEGIEVKGKVIVEGGGENSIKSKYSKYYEKFLITAENPVRVVIEGDAVKIEAYKGTNVTLTGNFEDVIVGLGVEMLIKDSKVETLIVASAPEEEIVIDAPVITIHETSKVDTVQANTAVELKGEGEIEELIVNTSGVSIEQAPEKIVVADEETTVDVEGETLDKEEAEDLKGNSNSSSSNGSNSSSSGSTTRPTVKDKYYITGTVTFEGDIVEHALVDLSALVGDEWEDVGSQVTDATGAFSFYVDSKKDYFLSAWVEAETGEGYHASTEGIYLDEDKEITLELEQYPVVIFTVVDKNNLAIPNIKVVPVINGEKDGWSYTDKLGQATRYVWDLSGMYGYEFYVGETLVHTMPEQNMSEGDLVKEITVVIDSMGLDQTIEGKIVNNAGQAVESAEVTLFHHEVYGSWSSSYSPIDTVITAANGIFSFDVPNADWLYAVKVEFKDESGDVYLSEYIDARNLSAQNGEIAIGQGYVFDYTVLDKQGMPLEGVEILLEFDGKRSWSEDTNTSGKSEFWLVGLPEGQAIIKATYGSDVQIHAFDTSESNYYYAHTFTFDVETNNKVAFITVENPSVQVGSAQVVANRVVINGYEEASDEYWSEEAILKDGQAIISVPETYQAADVNILVYGKNGEMLYRETGVSFIDKTLERTVDLAQLPVYTIEADIRYTTEGSLQIATDAKVEISLQTYKESEAIKTAIATNGVAVIDGLIASHYILNVSYTIHGQNYVATQTIRDHEFRESVVSLVIELNPETGAVLASEQE